MKVEKRKKRGREKKKEKEDRFCVSISHNKISLELSYADHTTEKVHASVCQVLEKRKRKIE